MQVPMLTLLRNNATAEFEALNSADFFFQKGGFVPGLPGAVGSLPFRRRRVGGLPDRPVHLDVVVLAQAADFRRSLRLTNLPPPRMEPTEHLWPVFRRKLLFPFMSAF